MVSIQKISRILTALAFATTAIVIKLPGFTIVTAELITVILFLLLLAIGKLVFRKKIIVALTVYLVISLLTAFLNGFNLTHVVISFMALNLYIVTLNSVFHMHRDNLERIINLYLTVAFFAATLAVFQEASFLLKFRNGYDLKWFFNGHADLTYSGIFLKVSSFFTEPGYLAPFLVPAAYFAIKSLVFRTTEVKTFRAIIILTAIIFTFSLIGYLGLILSLFILFRKNLAIAALVTALFFGYGMMNVQSIKPRIDAFVNSFQSGVRINYNYSSLIIILNFHITKEAFKQNPVFGSGIDGYEMMSDRIIKAGFSESVLNRFVRVSKPESLMLKDGGNLFFRILVEYGLVGMTLIALVFTTNFRRANYSKHIQFMCLIFIFTFGVRTGQYLRYELWFFIMLFFHAPNYTQPTLQPSEESLHSSSEDLA